MKKKTLINLILMASILMYILCGCGFTPFDNVNGTGDVYTANHDNLIVVGVSQLGSESAWRSANTESIQKALTKENGFFMIFNNARQKQENQIKDIRSFISQRVDYIVFAPVVEEGWSTVLNEAKDANIPVIIMDRQVSLADGDLYTTRVGTDAKAEGMRAGQWLEDALIKEGRQNEEINIAVIQGTRGSSAQRGRAMGFDIVCDSHPNWNIVIQLDGDFTTSKGRECAEQILQLGEDIDVLVCHNDDMAIGAIEAFCKAGITTGVDGEVMVISFDATKEGMELVKNGMINVDVECNPNQGEYISDVIKKLEAGEAVEKEYIVDEKVFTIENVDTDYEDRTY